MVDAVSVSSDGGGKIGCFGKSEEVDGDVAEGGQVVGATRVTDSATVFVPVGVADPMQTILDAPMPTPECQQLGCARALGRKTGDRVRDFLCLLTPTGSRPFQAADLGEARPHELRNDPRTGL